MSIKITDEHGTPFVTLNAINRTLAAGEAVYLQKDTEVLHRICFRCTPDSSFKKAVFVSGRYPDDIESIIEHLSGNDIQKKKVQWFDGAKFHCWIQAV
jgi:hypothetical protein